MNSIEGNSLLLEPVVCDSAVILFVRNIKDCYFSHSSMEKWMGKWLRFRRDVTWMTGLPSQAANPKESAAYPELNFRTIRCRWWAVVDASHSLDEIRRETRRLWPVAAEKDLNWERSSGGGRRRMETWTELNNVVANCPTESRAVNPTSSFLKAFVQCNRVVVMVR